MHDGENMLGRSSDRPPRESGNFKFVEWDDVAEAFDDELIVDPDGWSPRG